MACARPASSIQYAGQCWPLDEQAVARLKRLEGTGRNDFARRVVLEEMGYNVEGLDASK